MPAAKYNYTIEQGTDFSRQLTFTDDSGNAVDLTGDTFSGIIKQTFDSVSTLATFTFDTTQASLGIIVFSLSDTTTDGLPSTLDTDPLVYDIKRTKAITGLESRVLQGKVKISPKVTA